MKFKINNYNDGDVRIVKRFALFPKSTVDEIRWLEWCYIFQEYSTNYADDGWHNKYFVTKKDWNES